ncbi:MAG: hypothetical protein AAFR38_00795 [Planctomycetota bacterium]
MHRAGSIAVFSSAALAASQPSSTGRFTFGWTNGAGERWTHAAVVERPDAALDNGHAVALFSGGYTADLDWTVPGSYTLRGQTTRLTLSGDDYTDGATLSDALTAAGFTVLRYSAIREGDPLHAENRVNAQTRPIEETYGLARTALRAMTERAGIPIGRTFVLGHSFGANRAAVVAEGAAGYVLLAGAYMSPTSAAPDRLAASATAEGRDFDGGGTVSGWERAAQQRLDGGIVRQGEVFRAAKDGTPEVPWASDRLLATGAPVLAVWGGLDDISMHGPLLERLRPATDTVYFPGFNHQLGEERGGLTGPIATEVVELIVGWLGERVGRGDR